jgi:hypothetical protein
MAEEWNQQIVGAGQEDQQELPRPRPVNPVVRRAWKDVTKEPMPPASPYHLFYQEEQAQVQGVQCVFALRRSRRKSDWAMRQQTRAYDKTPEDTPEEHAAQRSTRANQLTERWRCLPRADKERYNDMHALAREEYRQDMERYNATLQLVLAKSESKRELQRNQNKRDELLPHETSPRSDSSSESHTADRVRALLNLTRTSFRDHWVSVNLM